MDVTSVEKCCTSLIAQGWILFIEKLTISILVSPVLLQLAYIFASTLMLLSQGPWFQNIHLDLRRFSFKCLHSPQEENI
ncbi:hypothetical protein JD844_026692 [Phrynosoma platyrhinos]|uniref:Uncharacterized protein n=1 Tax=Phrynosoma platyrhinos TaxID=52577 RepID=A0ABQ7SFE3_PHRPL|nr:hypothetical protein JD844_026692 [Phrynosoma platyrhinos]